MGRIIKKSLLLALGFFILTAGVSFCISSELGISPVSSNPYVLSRNLPLTMGVFTMLMHLIYIVLKIILEKKITLMTVLQMLAIVVVGLFQDLNNIIFAFLSPQTYFTRWLCCIAGSLLIALGLTLEIKADFITTPSEGFMKTLSTMKNINYGKVKTVNDIILVLLACSLSIIFEGKISGIREGTAYIALSVGTYIGFFLKLYDKIFVKKAN